MSLLTVSSRRRAARNEKTGDKNRRDTERTDKGHALRYHRFCLTQCLKCGSHPFPALTYLLHKATGEEGYLEKAKGLFLWERGKLFDAATGKVFDNIQAEGCMGRFSRTHNQGTFVGAASRARLNHGSIKMRKPRGRRAAWLTIFNGPAGHSPFRTAAVIRGVTAVR